MKTMFREFRKECPDYNFMLSEGHIERIATNRSILTIMTEFGLNNCRTMKRRELLSFIESLQMVKINYTTPPCILDIVENITSMEPFTTVPPREMIEDPIRSDKYENRYIIF